MPARSHPRPPADPRVLNGATGSKWTNLGFWVPDSTASAGTLHYPDAARTLARRVASAATLRAGDVVVDYACGFGDSLKLWVEEYGAQRVVGVEPDPSVCAAVTERIREWKLEQRIRIHCARAEDLRPRQADAEVSAVVCVDAAYHFHSRRTWLGLVAADCSEGTRFGLADLSVLPGSERSLRLRALARLMHIPSGNLMSARSISIAAEDAGFSVLSCEHIGTQVLDGFVGNAPRGSLAVEVTRSAIAYARRYRLLDYCVIGAAR